MSLDFTTRAPVMGRRGAIATSNYLATEAGLRMLREGGNAVALGHSVKRAITSITDDLPVGIEPVLVADPRWYATAASGASVEEFWRDPWVYADPGGDGWHLLGVEAGRDYEPRFVDIREAREGDVCPVCGGSLRFQTAIEVGHIFKFGTRPGLLVKTPGGELRAYSARCTHLDCTVQYREDIEHIWCACHNGHYDLNGKNIAGPPPGPLQAYDVNLRGDEIIVSVRT